MGIDRRQFLKFLAFIPFVASGINFNPKYGVGGIVGIAAEGIPEGCLVNLNVRWSADGVTWYDVLDHPFFSPLLCEIDGEVEFSNGGMVGGIIIDKDSN